MGEKFFYCAEKSQKAPVPLMRKNLVLQYGIENVVLEGINYGRICWNSPKLVNLAESEGKRS